jgi:CDP-glycerol glycerophosphotransferase
MIRLRNAAAQLLFKMFRLIPLRNNRITIESIFGNNITGNPKYLAIELLKNYHDTYQIIIATRNGNSFLGHPTVKKKSIKYLYFLATSKVWITNGRSPLTKMKREETILLQTWHGTPLKRLVSDVVESNVNDHSQGYKASFIEEVEKWDFLLAQNEFSARCFKTAFHISSGSKTKIMVTGYPRNEIFFREDLQEHALENLSSLVVPDRRKVVLYAPTFRDDNRDQIGQIEDVLELASRYVDSCIFLLRGHYISTGSQVPGQYPANVKIVSSYDDVQELLFLSDILITDYSSLMFDFAHTKRPMLFYAPDLDKYEHVLRGFYIDYKDSVPGPVSTTRREFFNHFKTVDTLSQSYGTKYETFIEKYCFLDNGMVSQNILRSVLCTIHEK